MIYHASYDLALVILPLKTKYLPHFCSKFVYSQVGKEFLEFSLICLAKVNKIRTLFSIILAQNFLFLNLLLTLHVNFQSNVLIFLNLHLAFLVKLNTIYNSAYLVIYMDK